MVGLENGKARERLVRAPGGAQPGNRHEEGYNSEEYSTEETPVEPFLSEDPGPVLGQKGEGGIQQLGRGACREGPKHQVALGWLLRQVCLSYAIAVGIGDQDLHGVLAGDVLALDVEVQLPLSLIHI